jgi:cell volume regulation protein A
MASLEVLLGVAAAVVLLGVLAVRASVRLGLPSLLLYLGIGILLGESVLGVQFSDAGLTEAAGLGALVLILTEGGLTTRWASVRPALSVGIALSTVAVVVSIAVVGTALQALLDLDWRTAFLWGAVLSSTDAAAVFSVLRGVGVSRRLRGALELESGMNDAPVVLAVILLASGDPITWLTPLVVVYELGLGAGLGYLLGRAGAWALRRAALPSTGLYPLAALAVCVLAYSAGQLAHASGLLATYIAALVLGNSHLPHRGDVLSFAEGTGWLAQIGLFVLLGLYASPPRLPAAVVPALIAGTVLVVAARPLSVIAAAAPFRVPWREQAFLSWSGLRGAVPIVLALVALQENAPGAQLLVDVVFVLVVVLTLLQGTTLPFVARRLGVVASEPREIEVDAAPLDELDADLLQVRVPPGSRLRGVYLRELRLPRGATVSLVVRDNEAFTPAGDTRLRVGDQFLVVTTAAARQAAERRIRAVDRAGRLARWYGESGR